MRRAWLAVLVLAAAPTVAEGQIFLASRPSPEFTIGPLFVRANVTPELYAVTVDVLWSLVIPPTKSGAAIEQDLYLLWPGPVGGALTGAAPDAALVASIKARGFVPIAEGRLPLFAESLYRAGDDVPPQPIAGGAPFVTFIQEGGPLGLTILKLGVVLTGVLVLLLIAHAGRPRLARNALALVALLGLLGFASNLV